jgi:hypothetical protein
MTATFQRPGAAAVGGLGSAGEGVVGMAALLDETGHGREWYRVTNGIPAAFESAFVS